MRLEFHVCVQVTFYHYSIFVLVHCKCSLECMGWCDWLLKAFQDVDSSNNAFAVYGGVLVLSHGACHCLPTRTGEC